MLAHTHTHARARARPRNNSLVNHGEQPSRYEQKLDSRLPAILRGRSEHVGHDRAQRRDSDKMPLPYRECSSGVGVAGENVLGCKTRISCSNERQLKLDVDG